MKQAAGKLFNLVVTIIVHHYYYYLALASHFLHSMDFANTNQLMLTILWGGGKVLLEAL